MFRYLSAEDIGRFFDKFEDEVIQRSGLDADELGDLSRTEMNELLNDLFEDVVITKDNIHLYYEFMRDEDLKSYRVILGQIFNDRNWDIIKLINELSSFDKRDTNFKLDWIKGTLLCTINEVFGVKDTLKSIDEYIAEIKASEKFQEYISSKLA